jgi:hypothetical protein
MNRSDWLTDQLIQAVFERRAGRADPGDLREAILTLSAASSQRSPWRLQFSGTISTPVPRRALLKGIAAATVFGVIAVGAALLVTKPDQPAVGGPGPTPDATVGASAPASPSTSPSPTAAALIWTQASLHEDWPAPVRIEPAGPPTVVPILSETPAWTVPYVDPTGDTGSDAFPWVDITDVTGPCSYCLSLRLVSYPPPAVDPTEQWIAYGVVADTDRDGVPDWRYGFDNMPGECDGCVEPWPHRMWRTDLHTGRTEMYVGDSIVFPSGTMFYGGPERLSFGGDVAGGDTINDRPERFYAWASVIQDGRVVATDYAPDAGWFLPSLNAKP